MKSKVLVRIMAVFIAKGCRGRKYRRVRRINMAYAAGWRREGLGSMARKRAYRTMYRNAESHRELINGMPELTEREKAALTMRARATMDGMLVGKLPRRTS